MEEKKGKELSSSSEESSFAVADDGDDRRLVLPELLPQLETSRGDGKLQQPEPPADDPKDPPSPEVGEAKSEIANAAVDGGGGVDDGGKEEIVKELREVKRQNFITHCLLSAMIVLTVAWQLSEVTLVLKIKNGLNNPFKSFGSMLTGMLKRPTVNGQNGEKESSANQQQIHLDLPLGSDSDED